MGKVAVYVSDDGTAIIHYNLLSTIKTIKKYLIFIERNGPNHLQFHGGCGSKIVHYGPPLLL